MDAKEIDVRALFVDDHTMDRHTGDSMTLQAALEDVLGPTRLPIELVIHGYREVLDHAGRWFFSPSTNMSKSNFVMWQQINEQTSSVTDCIVWEHVLYDEQPQFVISFNRKSSEFGGVSRSHFHVWPHCDLGQLRLATMWIDAPSMGKDYLLALEQIKIARDWIAKQFVVQCNEENLLLFDFINRNSSPSLYRVPLHWLLPGKKFYTPLSTWDWHPQRLLTLKRLRNLFERHGISLIQEAITSQHKKFMQIIDDPRESLEWVIARGHLRMMLDPNSGRWHPYYSGPTENRRKMIIRPNYSFSEHEHACRQKNPDTFLWYHHPEIWRKELMRRLVPTLS